MSLPKIIFNSKTEFLSKRNKMYDNIKQCIDDWVINDTIEYNAMTSLDMGLTPRQNIHISQTLTDELKSFTENKCDEWCNEISFHIMVGIASFLDGLLKIDRLDDFSPEECTELIYNSITYQLDGERAGHEGMLSDVVSYPNESNESNESNTDTDTESNTKTNSDSDSDSDSTTDIN